MNITATIITAIISCIVSFCLGGALSFFFTKYKSVVKKEKAERDGMRELLRCKLIDYHDKYVDRGSCPIYIKEAATRSYEAYHDLGGNGVITGLYQELMALCVSSEEKGGKN